MNFQVGDRVVISRRDWLVTGQLKYLYEETTVRRVSSTYVELTIDGGLYALDFSNITKVSCDLLTKEEYSRILKVNGDV